MQNKRKDIVNVPNLRFPGFEGEWKSDKLGELAEISSGGTPNRNTPGFWNGEIPWITTSLINFNVIKKAEEFITEQGVKGSSAKLFPRNTILMAMYGQGKTRGQVAILDIEATTNQACAAIMPKSNLIDYSFLFQNLSKRYDEIRELSNQGGQQNLSGGIIKGISIQYPSLKEQKKVAALLSRIDLRIDTQSKIIEELIILKSSTVKQIFWRQLRFKKDNGNDFPNWESKTLGEVLEYEQPTGYLVTSAEYRSDYETPVITAGKTFILGYTNEKDGVFASERLPVIIFDDFTTATQYVNFQFKAKSSAMKILSAKKGVDIKFIYEAMQMINYEIGGHGRHWISIYSALEISVPIIEEQIIIADFLTKLDDKINLETNLYEKLIMQKRYMLKNLLI